MLRAFFIVKSYSFVTDEEELQELEEERDKLKEELSDKQKEKEEVDAQVTLNEGIIIVAW